MNTVTEIDSAWIITLADTCTKIRTSADLSKPTGTISMPRDDSIINFPAFLIALPGRNFYGLRSFSVASESSQGLTVTEDIQLCSHTLKVP